jgi:hypothetical protein
LSRETSQSRDSLLFLYHERPHTSDVNIVH